MNWEALNSETIDQIMAIVTRRTFYIQIAAILLTALVSWFSASAIRRKLEKVEADSQVSEKIRPKTLLGSLSYQYRLLLFPAFNAALLGVTVSVSREVFDQNWLIQLVQGANFLALVVIVATRLSQSANVRFFLLYVLSPIFALYAVNLLDDLVLILERTGFQLGNIKLTLYAAVRTVLFGVVLIWLARVVNAAGQEIIRKRAHLDTNTRELASKAFQIILVVLIGIIVLQVAGIDLTALVVFGGAIGVGLGFGLQQIAANFISGVIILLDRSLTIGDFIELEDGRAGRLRQLSMRHATLETFEGKDIMVPNDRFITTAFTNWTHQNEKQRYPITFTVAYGTDLDELFELIREVVASHPRVISGEDIPIEEQPDAEIKAFGDNGIEILVEFWMIGIDDGPNRVGADLNLMIWQTLKANAIEIPFPQREVIIKETRKG